MELSAFNVENSSFEWVCAKTRDLRAQTLENLEKALLDPSTRNGKPASQSTDH